MESTRLKTENNRPCGMLSGPVAGSNPALGTLIHAQILHFIYPGIPKTAGLPPKNAPSDSVLDRLLASQRLAKETKMNYVLRINKFLAHIQKSPEEFLSATRKNPKAFEQKFIEYLKVRNAEVSSSTVWMDRDALKKLFELNRVQGIDWNYIHEYLPKHKKFGEDRAPTLEEVKKMVDRADLRMKCLILFLCSSGARIGSIEWLRWKDVEEVEADQNKLAKVTIYAGETEQYMTFITPECYRHLMEYKAGRERLGEKVVQTSRVFVTIPNRRQFDPSKVRPMPVKGMKNALRDLLNEIGMRTAQDKARKYRNYEFKQAHGFRKFFKTRMEMSGVKPIITELLMGHAIGVSNSYMKPTETELIEEYTKAIPNISILETKASTKEDIKQSFKREILLQIAGYKEEEVDKMDLSSIADEDFQKMVREKLLGAMTNNGSKQKVIPIGEVENHLTKGWEFVAALPDDRAILKLPF
jgi:integrase